MCFSIESMFHCFEIPVQLWSNEDVNSFPKAQKSREKKNRGKKEFI